MVPLYQHHIYFPHLEPHTVSVLFSPILEIHFKDFNEFSGGGEGSRVGYTGQMGRLERADGTVHWSVWVMKQAQTGKAPF